MLRFNESNGAFVLYTNDRTDAEATGLTFMTNVRGPNGEYAYYTADYNKEPTYNPYAALPFYDQADLATQIRLDMFKQDYDASWAEDSSYEPPCPDGESYMPYQKAGIKYAMDSGNVLFGDEPGLGKTVQLIGYANAVEAKNVLVLTPASIRLNWEKMIHRWSTIRGVTTYPVLKSADGVHPTSNYVIASYDLARNQGIFNALMERRWDMIMLDEAHYLKSPEAQRTRSVFGGGMVNSNFHDRWLQKRADIVAAATGTYLPNRPREAYMLGRGLNHMAFDFMSEDSFKFRFNPSYQTRDGYNLEDQGRLPELQARMRCNFMVRRLKKDVLPQLPEKSYEMNYIEPDGAIREVLKKEALIDFDPEDLLNPNFKLDGHPISTIRREMGLAKVPRVIDYIKYLLDIVGLHKIVVFYHHTDVMKEIYAALDDKYGVVGSYGGQTPTKREANTREFINGEPRVWLAQLDTVEGVDGIQDVASHLVFAEPAWTPGRNEQCIDRCHRLGQQFAVLGQFLVAPGSIDEKVLEAVVFKAQTIYEAMDRRF